MDTDPPSGRVVKVRLEDIRVGRRRRRLMIPKVEEIAASIERDGLQHPVHVAPRGDGTWLLVAGAHRAVACKRLGHAEIDAYVFDGDAREQAIWEITENLTRAELTPLERADHIARLKELLGHGNFGTSCPENRRGRPRGVASEVALRYGGSKKDVNRALRRAALPQSVKARIWQRPDLDTGQFLDKLARQPDEAAMHRLIDEPKPPPAGNPDDRRVAALRRLLKHADDDLLARFIREGVHLARKRPRLWAEVAREFDGAAPEDDSALLYRSWERVGDRERAWAAAQFARWALQNPDARPLLEDVIAEVGPTAETRPPAGTGETRGEQVRQQGAGGPAGGAETVTADPEAVSAAATLPNPPPVDDANVSADLAPLLEWLQRRDVLADLPS